MPSFRDLFAADAAVRAQAPGRVNVIGEHTDYNDGFVLPAAIPKFTRVELAPHANQLVRAHSDIDGSAVPAEFELGSEAPHGHWIDYVQGVTAALRTAGIAPEGFDLRVSSDIPVGAGLSSSAALSVTLLRALREAYALELDDVALARIAHAAETDFVGAPVGSDGSDGVQSRAPGRGPADQYAFHGGRAHRAAARCRDPGDRLRCAARPRTR
ncbi:MAG: hypothetical protein IT532_14375 [Burkholderiales bacterium]|nr:hypothetical protein [Burkholderiales bacterium]